MTIQQKFDLTGRVAVVTGGVGLLGAEFCRTLAEAGAAVVVVDLNESASQAVSDSLTSSGYKALAVPTDITQPDSVNALVHKTLTTFGRLDILVNSAALDPKFDPDAVSKGITPGAFEDYPLDQWNAAMNVNLTGMFLCTQEAIKIMKAQSPRGGRIINNGSISAHAPRPYSVAYTSTKHAVTGLTKSTSLDCRQYDVCCGQVDIGNAATPLTDRMVQGEGVLQPDGSKRIEPRMDAEHVGNAVAYMASLPLDSNVLFMTVMANKMPFVGRG